MKTLEEILEKTKNDGKGGIFGIDACKESIEWSVENRIRLNGETRQHALFELLQEYLDRAQDDILFNKTMIQACWQLINNR